MLRREIMIERTLLRMLAVLASALVFAVIHFGIVCHASIDAVDRIDTSSSRVDQSAGPSTGASSSESGVLTFEFEWMVRLLQSTTMRVLGVCVLVCVCWVTFTSNESTSHCVTAFPEWSPNSPLATSDIS